MSGNTLPPYVIEAAMRWRQGYESLREMHDQGASGKRIAIAFSDLLDEVVTSIFNACLRDNPQASEIASKISVVMHGGCGRREVCPHSDVDLMLLCHSQQEPGVKELATLLSQGINDAGFTLGFTVQTPRQACSLAFAQPETFTSLIDARSLAGSVELFDSFILRLQRLAVRRSSAIMRRIFQARDEERVKFGETVYLLRPNVKKSRGGLRDIHLVRWIGFVRYGEAEFDELLKKNAIPKVDFERLNASNEFLLRIRNDLHFQANRLNDVLGRNEQVRIAEKFGYASRDELLSVENLMRDYFRSTSDVRFCSDNFVQNAQPRPTIANMLAPIVSRNVDEHFRMGPFQIGARPGAVDHVKGNLESVLRLLQLANLHNREIEPATWEAIRNRMLASSRIKLDEASAHRFMALVDNPDGLGKSLRRLHEMRVLEKIIPGFRHARGLLQFNEYHQYTVDEHSILAVERASELKNDSSFLGDVYRSIRDKQILHLALLLHDLGKGFPEDHSEVGARIAKRVVKRLGLSDTDGETVRYLVYNHLVMSHLALHRDISDNAVVAEFASNVGSVNMLKMLYVLTCADIAAVGPDTLNQWKLGLLTELYRNAKNILTGEDPRENNLAERKNVEADLTQLFDDEITILWLADKIKDVPPMYLRNQGIEKIANQLLELKELPKNEIACWSNFCENSNISNLCIGTHEKVRSGIFFKTCGLLARLGLRIKSVDISRLGDSMIWYWFQYEDEDFEGPPPEYRLEEIKKLALAAAIAPPDETPRFRNRWGNQENRAEQLSRPPIRVLIDNQSVEDSTIIDVFAFRKLGLLYTISKKIFEMNLDVQSARISTYGHQVVCVVYVTDANRQKIRDQEQMDKIQKSILKSTRSFLRKRKAATKK